jgi:uncharacterized damage-inducible protein DinB
MTEQQQRGPTPEFAIAYRQLMLDGLSGELETTKRVIGAIPDSKSDYRHDPNSRTAWELAWHLANTDIQFLNGIADLNFAMESPKPEDKPKNVAELVAWYDTNFKSAAKRVAALSADQLVTPVDFLGAFNFPVVLYLGFLNNHSIHHRGELATFLRPMGSKVPNIYGGSFDEPMQMPEPATNAA